MSWSKVAVICAALILASAGVIWSNHTTHAQQGGDMNSANGLKYTGPWVVGDSVAASATTMTLQDGGAMPQISGTLTTGDALCGSSGMIADCGAIPYAPASCTTAAIGGGLLLAGAAATGTCTLPRSSTNCDAQAADGSTVFGLGGVVGCTVNGTTATVSVAAIVALTPASKTYKVTGF